MNKTQKIDRQIQIMSHRMRDFVLQTKDDKDLTLRGLARKSNLSITTLRNMISGKMGNFRHVCMLFRAMGTSFEDYYSSFGEECPSPMAFFCKQGFARANRRYKNKCKLTNRQISRILCREETAFAQFCNDNYDHWCQLNQITIHSALFHVRSSEYLGVVAEESKKLLHSTMEKKQPINKEDYIFLKDQECEKILFGNPDE